MARLTINGKSHDIDVVPSTPLLWAIRDHAGLTGTKYGCGIGECARADLAEMQAAVAKFTGGGLGLATCPRACELSPWPNLDCAEVVPTDFAIGRIPSQPIERIGGAERNRTADLLIANEALSQLSYGP